MYFMSGLSGEGTIEMLRTVTFGLLLFLAIVVILILIGFMVYAVYHLYKIGQTQAKVRDMTSKIRKRLGKQNFHFDAKEDRFVNSIIFAEEIKTGWESICIPKDIVDQLHRHIILPVMGKDVLHTLPHPIKLPNGILFNGSPGTGKSLLARVLSKETQCSLLRINPCDLHVEYFETANSVVAALFSLAKKLSPCILLMEQIDSLFNKNAFGQFIQLTAAFTACWDGKDTSSNNDEKNKDIVIIMGSTSRHQEIEPNLLRRFDLNIEIPSPTYLDRIIIFDIHLKGITLEKGFSVKRLAALTNGFTGADLQEVVRYALVGLSTDKLQEQQENKADKENNNVTIPSQVSPQPICATPDESKNTEPKKVASDEKVSADIKATLKDQKPIIQEPINTKSQQAIDTPDEIEKTELKTVASDENVSENKSVIFKDQERILQEPINTKSQQAIDTNPDEVEKTELKAVASDENISENKSVIFKDQEHILQEPIITTSQQAIYTTPEEIKITEPKTVASDEIVCDDKKVTFADEALIFQEPMNTISQLAIRTIPDPSKKTETKTVASDENVSENKKVTFNEEELILQTHINKKIPLSMSEMVKSIKHSKKSRSHSGGGIGGLDAHEIVIAGLLIQPDELNVTFKNIAGLNDVIRDIKRQVILPIMACKNNEKGKSKLVSCPKGILFHGPPGTGKTLLAKAMAYHSKCAFINLDLSVLFNKYYGESGKLAAALFRLAEKYQPSIIFIDEIDGFLRTRESADSELSASLKAQFLSLWDGILTDPGKVIIVMGASNRPEKIDEAVMRRLTKKFNIPLPELESREQVLKLILDKENIADDVNFKILAALTDGFSPCELKDMITSAAINSLQMMEPDDVISSPKSLKSLHLLALDNCRSVEGAWASWNGSLENLASSASIKFNNALKEINMSSFVKAIEEAKTNKSNSGAPPVSSSMYS